MYYFQVPGFCETITPQQSTPRPAHVVMSKQTTLLNFVSKDGLANAKNKASSKKRKRRITPVLVEEKQQPSATAPSKDVDAKQPPKKERKRSKISFESKSWNFGDIRDGDIVNHDFKFKNLGNAPLEVKNVTATCGCTQPSFPFLPIAPGEEGTISVTFNSTGKINEQRPTVTVITNGKPSIVKLNLEGMVRPKL